MGWESPLQFLGSVTSEAILAMLCRTVAELDHISSPTAMAEQPWL